MKGEGGQEGGEEPVPTMVEVGEGLGEDKEEKKAEPNGRDYRAGRAAAMLAFPTDQKMTWDEPDSGMLEISYGSSHRIWTRDGGVRSALYRSCLATIMRPDLWILGQSVYQAGYVLDALTHSWPLWSSPQKLSLQRGILAAVPDLLHELMFLCPKSDISFLAALGEHGVWTQRCDHCSAAPVSADMATVVIVLRPCRHVLCIAACAGDAEGPPGTNKVRGAGPPAGYVQCPVCHLRPESWFRADRVWFESDNEKDSWPGVTAKLDQATTRIHAGVASH